MSEAGPDAEVVFELTVDPTAIDWRAYLQDVHCPSITATVRRAGQRRTSPTAWSSVATAAFRSRRRVWGRWRERLSSTHSDRS